MAISKTRQYYQLVMDRFEDLHLEIKKNQREANARKEEVFEALQIVESAKSFQLAELIDMDKEDCKAALASLLADGKINSDGRVGLPTYSV